MRLHPCAHSVSVSRCLHMLCPVWGWPCEGMNMLLVFMFVLQIHPELSAVPEQHDCSGLYDGFGSYLSSGHWWPARPQNTVPCCLPGMMISSPVYNKPFHFKYLDPSHAFLLPLQKPRTNHRVFQVKLENKVFISDSPLQFPVSSRSKKQQHFLAQLHARTWF